MSSSEIASSNILRRARKYFRRTDKIQRPFIPYGLLPLLGLGIVSLFAITSFANGVENRAKAAAEDALLEAGAVWAKPEANGQWVTLTGTPPSDLEAAKAQRAVRDQKGGTWLGFKAKPVTRVNTNWTYAEVVEPVAPVTSLAPSPDWRFELANGLMTLTGEVPDEASRARIVREARALINPPRLTSIQDQLVVTGEAPPRGYQAVALRGVSTVAQCDYGVASFQSEQFSLRCGLPQASSASVQAQASAPLPLGNLGVIEMITNEAVTSCEDTLKRLLSATKIEFAPSKADIAPSSTSLLSAISQTAFDCPGTLRIEGHTDNTGRPEFNELLSRMRAEAVRSKLVDLGLPAERLVARGYGDTRPIGDNATREGRARNRRIEIKVARPTE